MPAKRKTLPAEAQLDREIKELDRDRARENRQLDERRARLVAARAVLAGKAIAPQAKARRFSQDDVADYLAEHPRSTYLEIAEGLGAAPTIIAAHLNRGKKVGRFVNDAGKWSLVEGWRSK
jgi:hypothetical protein